MKCKSWTYSRVQQRRYWSNEAIGNVTPHLTLNISMSRRSVSQTVCKESDSISLKLEIIIFSRKQWSQRGSVEHGEGAEFLLLPVEFLQDSPLRIKRIQLTDDVPQQQQSCLDLHPFDSILMMSQSGSQYSSRHLYVQDICMRHPVSTSLLGHCSPKQLLIISRRRSGGKTRGETQPEQPESTGERRMSQSPQDAPSKSNSHFTFSPLGFYILLVTRVSGRQKIKSSSASIFMSIWESSRGTSFSLCCTLM